MANEKQSFTARRLDEIKLKLAKSLIDKFMTSIPSNTYLLIASHEGNTTAIIAKDIKLENDKIVLSGLHKINVNDLIKHIK
jgi:hypothetical protein